MPSNNTQKYPTCPARRCIEPQSIPMPFLSISLTQSNRTCNMPRNQMLPGILKEWHPTKNGDLRPEKILATTKVWWICFFKSSCADDCDHVHEWQASIKRRFRSDGRRICGCPWCSSYTKIVCPCQTLEKKRPDLAREWHPTKNYTLSPKDVAVFSHKAVWWVHIAPCADTCTQIHEWSARIDNRANGCGCPWCSGQGNVVCPCKSLVGQRPDLAKQYHPTKNQDFLPEHISVSSNKKVWWECEKGHEWVASVKARNNGTTGCPDCNLNKVETKMDEILSTHHLVSSYGKPTILCYDKIMEKPRRLRPDCIGITINGNKFMIELDGQQHFQTVSSFGPNGTDLRDQICRDLAKNRYAADHRMSLLRISYLEYNDLEMWVNLFLEKCAQTTEQVMIPSNPALYNAQRDVPL